MTPGQTSAVAIESVSINVDLKIGSTIKAVLTPTAADQLTSRIDYIWTTGDNKAISTCNGKTCKLTDADLLVGKTIKIKVLGDGQIATGTKEFTTTNTVEAAPPGECASFMTNCVKCDDNDNTYCVECEDKYGLRGGYCTKCRDDLFESNMIAL